MILVDNPYMTRQTVAMSGGMTFNKEFANRRLYRGMAPV
jgi:hypothetical protein